MKGNNSFPTSAYQNFQSQFRSGRKNKGGGGNERMKTHNNEFPSTGRMDTINNLYNSDDEGDELYDEGNDDDSEDDDDLLSSQSTSAAMDHDEVYVGIQQQRQQGQVGIGSSSQTAISSM